MPIPKCTSRVPLMPAQMGPGTTVHLAGAQHCRMFVVTSGLQTDPVTGHEVWQAMEVGTEKIVEGAEEPFTGVVMPINKDNIRVWHAAPTTPAP